MAGREEITREILRNVPGWLAVSFYVLAGIALAIALAGFIRRLRRHRQGKPSRNGAVSRPLSERLRSVATYLLFQRELRRDPFAGIAHLLVTYGFLILFIGTCLVFLEHDTPLHFFYGWFYLLASLVIDLGGLAFLVGLGMFLWRRYGNARTSMLKDWWVASLSWLLLAIGVTGFLLEGARIAYDFPPFERWSTAGYAVALAIDAAGLGGPRSLGLHRGLWSLHALLCVAFFVLLPWQFFGHMVYGLLSWSTRTTASRSALQSSSAAVSPGARVWQDFSATDLLQADACTTCGRCNMVCPANAAGKPLQPRNIVLGLRGALAHANGASLAGWFADETLWSCTTCGACNEACPVGIDVYGKIVELRRGRIEAGVVPAAAEQVYETVAEQGNPYGKPESSRMDWARGLDVPVAEPDEPVELLYWVGCAGSYDPDGQGVARSMVRILKHLGINFRVLGSRERCTGDPARRLGEEGLFQRQAREVSALLERQRVTRILTHCPHCFNAFQNEYASVEGHTDRPWTVIHHSEFLAELIAAGRLAQPSPEQGTVTFHDPCYLGRGNGIVSAPRDVLQQAVELPVVEMSRHGRNSFCCGAGGGAAWVDVPGRERVEQVRAREALDTGATTIVTGCPFCKVMLRTGVQGLTESAPRVRDLAELVAEGEGLAP